MDFITKIDPQIYHYVVLPVLIFLARVIDVTIGTVRIMLVSRGRKILSPLLGFIEMLIWIIVIRQIVIGMDNWVTYIAFAAGFATGNFVGMLIEEKLAMGVQVVRIITRKEAQELIAHLKEAGYGITTIDAQGISGKVNLIFTIVKRSEVYNVIKLVKEHTPKAFYSVEDIRSVAGDGYISKRKGLNGKK